MAVLLLATIVGGTDAPVLFTLWVIANAGLGFVMTVWGAFHPRTVLRAAPAALPWAFWLAAAGALSWYSYFESLLAENLGLSLPGGLMFLPALAVFVGLFTGLMIVAWYGAALGGFQARGSPDPGQGAERGIGAVFAACLIAAVGSGLVSEVSFLARSSPAILLGLPWLTLGLCSLLARVRPGPGALLQQAVNWMGERLVWRRHAGRRGRIRTIDLRGASLGILTAVAVSVVSSAGLLLPLQTRVLVSLMQVGSPALGLDRRDRESWRAGQRIVILEMDDPVIREAVTTGSEAALQADVIRKLAAWKPRAIVLPMPEAVAGQGFDFQLSTTSVPRMPELNAGDLERSRRDMPRLLAAVQDAGSVILVSLLDDRQSVRRVLLGGIFRPSVDPSTGTPQVSAEMTAQLEHAAAKVGRPAITIYSAARLPAIDVGLTPRPPIALALAAAATGRPLAPGQSSSGRAWTLAGFAAPEVEPQKVLVHFMGDQPGQVFRRLRYSSVLGDQAVYVEPDYRPLAPARRRGEWQPMSTYLRDRLVILDSFARPVHETPLGTMPVSEMIAQAAVMFTRRDFVRRPDFRTAFLWMVLPPLLIGLFCAHRDPLAAGWRAGLVAMLLAASASLVYSIGHVWLDPVAPVLACILAFLLVTRLTFGLERRQREANRRLVRQFLAPQVAEEFLDDPERKLRLGGARQEVCVLFADVRGFSRFSEQHTPEEVMRVINIYLSALREALFAHDGILDKYTGDGLMAFFHLGSDPAADLRRAVHAALAMRDAAEQVSRELMALGQEPLRVGIGLHCGPAIVGLVGNPDHVNYTALGKTVVISQRLQGIAAGGEIVISQEVYTALAGAFPVYAGEPMQVKGLTELVRPYRVLPPHEAPAAPELDPPPAAGGPPA